MSATIREGWHRIEKWCRRNLPGLLAGLNSGATEEQVGSVEHVIQQSLPEEVRESLFIHNGQLAGTSVGFLFGQLTLASCDRIALEYEHWKGSDPGDPPTTHTFFPEDAIANRYHHDGWIPIAYEDGCGNCLAVDLAPGPSGIRGQIIDFGADIYDQGVLAPSWGEFLISYAKLLESGLLGKIDTDTNAWREPFESLFKFNALDALVEWAKDGRWPLR